MVHTYKQKQRPNTYIFFRFKNKSIYILPLSVVGAGVVGAGVVGAGVVGAGVVTSVDV